MQTARHDTMHSVNTSVLFQCLREEGALTRLELQRKTGLSWGTVSNIVTELLEAHIVTETPVDSSQVGRRPVTVDFDCQHNLCIGLDIHMQGITCTITDLRGNKLWLMQEPIVVNTRQGVLSQAVRMVRTVLEVPQFNRNYIIGIGISIQGSVDTASGISLYSPHLPEWKNVPLCNIFAKVFQLPTVLIHDADAMLLAEQWYSKHNTTSMAFIRLDMGVGMGLIVNNRFWDDRNGANCEFGHMIIKAEGRRCTCGNQGCLEAYASGRSILEQAEELVQAGKADFTIYGDTPLQRFESIAQSAVDGSKQAVILFERLGFYLGIGLANLINTIHPELVVLGGVMKDYSALFLNRAIEVMHRNVWTRNGICVTLSELEDSGAAAGASIAVIKRVDAQCVTHPIGRWLEIMQRMPL